MYLLLRKTRRQPTMAQWRIAMGLVAVAIALLLVTVVVVVVTKL